MRCPQDEAIPEQNSNEDGDDSDEENAGTSRTRRRRRFRYGKAECQVKLVVRVCSLSDMKITISRFKVEIYSNKPLMAEIWQRGEHEPAPQEELSMSSFIRRTILERFYYGSTTSRILKDRK